MLLHACMYATIGVHCENVQINVQQLTQRYMGSFRSPSRSRCLRFHPRREKVSGAPRKMPELTQSFSRWLSPTVINQLFYLSVSITIEQWNSFTDFAMQSVLLGFYWFYNLFYSQNYFYCNYEYNRFHTILNKKDLSFNGKLKHLRDWWSYSGWRST